MHERHELYSETFAVGVDSVSKWTLAGGQSGQASDDIRSGDKGAKCEVFHKLSLGVKGFAEFTLFIASLLMTPPELKWSVILHILPFYESALYNVKKVSAAVISAQ